jgi:hypothetical protein
LLDQRFELIIGILVSFQSPQAFGAQIGIRSGRQAPKTGLRFGEFAVVLEAAALIQRLSGQGSGGEAANNRK